MSRFRTLLLPIDFSTHAGTALELAIALARDSDATIHLFHSYEIPLGTIPPYGVAIPEELLSDVRDAAARRLEKAARRLADAGIRSETHILHAAPADGITEAARGVGADLIVMGTRGLTGLKHLMLGSVAERTVRTAPCPVLTVREGEAHAPHGSVGRFRVLVVPLDFSTHSDAALDLAIELAREHRGEIALVHAYELPVTVTLAYGVAIPQPVWDGVQQAAKARLEQTLARIQAAGVSGATQLVTAPAADAIVAAAAERGADLIVMATRGLTGMKHVLLGSVAERTLRLAPCPVLTLRSEV
jgi:nucleotide-binding universal stress UspA family protein